MEPRERETKVKFDVEGMAEGFCKKEKKRFCN